MSKQLKKYIDRKLLLLMIGFYTAFAIFSLAKMIYFKSIGDRFTEQSWSYMFFNIYLLDYLLVILFMSVVLMLTKYMIEKKKSWLKIIIVHLILSIILGFFIFIGILLIQRFIGISTSKEITFHDVLYAYMNVIDLNFLVYFSIVGITHTYYYLKKISESELQKIKLKDNLLQAKMKLLQSQIKPHFLFNTLNSIYTLMEGDKKKSQEMLIDLSELLRDMIDLRDESLVGLNEELHLLEKYLRITKIRFSNNLKIDLNIRDDDVLHALVPSITLQPIIENSIKHGFSGHSNSLDIVIDIYKENDFLFFVVKNNGKPLANPLDKLVNKGTGITNILKRLNMLYKENYSYNIYNSKQWVVTKVKIPYNTSNLSTKP